MCSMEPISTTLLNSLTSLQAQMDSPQSPLSSCSCQWEGLIGRSPLSTMDSSVLPHLLTKSIQRSSALCINWNSRD
jgi:hypothetical protein